MVATQQVWGGGESDMGAFRQGKADGGLTYRKRWLHPIPSSYD
jgi:hypothetical protein